MGAGDSVKGWALLWLLSTIAINSAELPTRVSSTAAHTAATLGADIGESQAMSPKAPHPVELLDNSIASTHPTEAFKVSTSNGDVGDPSGNDTPDQSSETRRNSTGLSGVPSSNYTRDELEHAAKLDQLYAEEHAGGVSQDASAIEALPLVDSESPNKTLPMTLAGQSGISPSCIVTGDQITVSGGGEAACLISEPLINSRLAPVEISFNVNFLKFPNEETGRNGGIFYGAPSAKSTRYGQPTVDWTDRKDDQGYRVYGNVDKNKAYGLSPGPNPNKHWKIIIDLSGKATFIAGPRTWLKDFTPKLSGDFVGFWVAAGNVMKITDWKVTALPLSGTDGHKDKPKTNKFFPGIQLSVDSREPYGSGVGRFFYSEGGGDRLEPKSLYLEGPSDFRTKEGSIVSAKDLFAAHVLIIKDYAADDSHHGARLFFVQNGHKKFQDNTLYLQDADFRTEKTDIVSDHSIQAGEELQVGAHDSQEFASLWYSQAGKGHTDTPKTAADNTILLRHGDFSTMIGSITGISVRASEYMKIEAMSGFGKGSAQLWYSEIGQNQVLSKTVYLESGHFRTQEGSILAARDLGGSSVQINAFESYGHGHATLFYTKEGNEHFQPNTLHAHRVSFATEKGSIQAAKDINVGRLMQVHASGTAKYQATLWYSQSAEHGSQYHDSTLYLKSGDLCTAEGSVYSARDAFASRYLRIGQGQQDSDHAMLWYSATATSTHDAKSLYLKSGDLRTEAGDIHSTSFKAGRYLAVGTENQAKLYFTATSKHGKESRSLYLKDGDFRIEAGSIISQNVEAGESFKISALPSFGAGTVNLWYVATPIGKQNQHAHTLYVGKGDFRTEDGSISSSDSFGAPSVQLAAYNGNGNSEIELWFGRHGETLGALKDGPPHVLYLREGNLETEVGDVIAESDLVVKTGSLSISARPGYGKSSLQSRGTEGTTVDQAELWYSHVGRDKYHSNTLYMRQGNFQIQSGSLRAKLDVEASKTLTSSKIEVDEASCKECHFNKIYLKSAMKAKTHALEDALVMLQEDDDQVHLDVGVALAKLRKRHSEIVQDHLSLRIAISTATEQLARLESR